MSQNISVAILAGGFGTRLGELTRDVPKPMIEVAGRPYLEFVLHSFASRGMRDFVLLTGHRSEVIEQHFGDGSAYGFRIRYSRERTPLGTGGALRDARALLGPRFLVTYGDVLRRFDYEHFASVHDEPCLAVYPRVTIGNTAIEGDRVTRFDKRAPELPYLDAGFIAANLIPRLLAEGHEVHGIDNFFPGKPEYVERWTGNKRCVFHQLDLVDRDAVVRQCVG